MPPTPSSRALPSDGLTVNANTVTVNGLTFNDSGAAGILVTPPSTATAPAAVTGVTIENVVSNNSDQCVNTPSTAVCTAAIGAGDYGESIWLLSVTDSTLENSTMENGLDGGLLVSDEMGPSSGNTIQNNMSVNNASGLWDHPGGAQPGRHLLHRSPCGRAQPGGGRRLQQHH